MYPVLAAFVILIAWLMVRNFRVISPDYRQKHYYKMTDDEIDQLVSTPIKCKFTFGQSGPGLDEPATIVLTKDSVRVSTDKGESETLLLKDVKKAESPDPGTLYIFPTWTKTLALLNDGRWGVFFGKFIFRAKLRRASLQVAAKSKGYVAS